ncbi:hypothetical protein AAG906_001107 [Vitis piasezkii]
MLQWVEVMTQKCINQKHDWRKLSLNKCDRVAAPPDRVCTISISYDGPNSKIIEMAWLIGNLQGLSYMARSQYAMPPINAVGMIGQAPAVIGM